MAAMATLVGEIRSATTDQDDAAQQSVQTLQEIGTIARQSASGSAQVTATVSELEAMTEAVLKTLAA